MQKSTLACALQRRRPRRKPSAAARRPPAPRPAPPTWNGSCSASGRRPRPRRSEPPRAEQEREAQGLLDGAAVEEARKQRPLRPKSGGALTRPPGSS
eukprot:408417-Lingulodinium_polyedra.AAC.1